MSDLGEKGDDVAVKGRVLALTGVLLALLLFAHWNTYPIDFSALYIAGQFYSDGASDMIYPQGTDFFWGNPPLEWKEKAFEAGSFYDEPPKIITPYVYPPLWIVPLGALSEILEFRQAANAVLVVQCLSLIVMMRMGFRLLNPQNVTEFHWFAILAVILATSTVTQLALGLGQPQIFVSMLTLLAFGELAKGKAIWAGGWLALAASIKLAPVLFVVVFLMERNWRALGSFVVIGGFLGALSVFCMGWPMHQAFLNKVAQIDGQVLVSRINLGLDFALFELDRIYQGTFDWRVYKPEVFSEPRWITWAIRIFLVVGLYYVHRSTLGFETHKRIWARLILVSLLLLFTSPLGWLHYLILPMLLLPGVLEFSRRGPVVAVMVVIVAGYSQPLFLWLADYWQTFLFQSALHISLAIAMFGLMVSLVRGKQEGVQH